MGCDSQFDQDDIRVTINANNANFDPGPKYTIGRPTAGDSNYRRLTYGDSVAAPQPRPPWSSTSGPLNLPEVNFIAAHTHVIKSLTFMEDRMIGVCSECGDQITVKTFPGSLNAIRARVLIEGYAANKLATRYDDEAISIGDVVEEIHMLRKLLALDKSELELAEERLALVEADLIKTINE